MKYILYRCFENWTETSFEGRKENKILFPYFRKEVNALINEFNKDDFVYLTDEDWQRFQKKNPKETMPNLVRLFEEKEYAPNKEKLILYSSAILELCNRAFEKIHEDFGEYDTLYKYHLDYYTYSRGFFEKTLINTKTRFVFYMRLVMSHVFDYYRMAYDCKRQDTFIQKTHICSSDMLSVLLYFVERKQVRFDNLDRKDRNTFNALKVINKFARKHKIRVDDAIEVFKEYFGVEPCDFHFVDNLELYLRNMEYTSFSEQITDALAKSQSKEQA